MAVTRRTKVSSPSSSQEDMLKIDAVVVLSPSSAADSAIKGGRAAEPLNASSPPPSTSKPPTSTKRKHSPDRPPYTDLALFLLPAAFAWVTDVRPLYLIGITRILLAHLMLALHWTFVDKEADHVVKISQRQLQRERNDYHVPIILHMIGQLVLQVGSCQLLGGKMGR